MKLLQKILLPVDFHPASIRAADTAIMLAQKFHSQITLLHVSSPGSISRESEKLLDEYSHEKMRQIESRIKKYGVETGNVLFRKGSPFDHIIDVAHNMDFNVVVVGSGNETEDKMFQLGTTVEKLIRKNQVPLWVVKNVEAVPIRNILCPVDFSEASERALGNAITLAHSLEAKLTVLNIYKPINIVSPRLKIDNEAENRKMRNNQQQGYQEFLRKFELNRVENEILSLQGEPHAEILDLIYSRGFDLLLMGTTGKTGLSRLLMGSVTEKVIREVPCSFITTKAKDITVDFLEGSIKKIEEILNSATMQIKHGKPELAAEIYAAGLKQYPDNIPLLKGLIESNESIGNKARAEYYRKYAREIIRRTWGEGLIGSINL
jgi:nucleotide-binding universal stress UspA family protein